MEDEIDYYQLGGGARVGGSGVQDTYAEFQGFSGGADAAAAAQAGRKKPEKKRTKAASTSPSAGAGVGNEDNGEAAKPRACLSCRSKHRKCDGKVPKCSECSHSGSICEYPLTSKKRGPPKGEKKQLEETVKALSEALANQKLETDKWKELYHDATAVGYSGNKDALDSVVNSGLNIIPSDCCQEIDFRSDHLALTAHLATYLDSYQKTNKALLSIPVPEHVDWDAVVKRDNTNCEILPLYAMMALGAAAIGKLSYAEEFANRSREMARDWFDKTNINAATAFTLLSYHFIGSGQLEVSSYYCSINRNMTTILRSKVEQQLQFISAATTEKDSEHSSPAENIAHLYQLSCLSAGKATMDINHQEFYIQAANQDVSINSSSCPKLKLNFALCTLAKIGNITTKAAHAAMLEGQLYSNSLRQDLTTHLNDIQKAEQCVFELVGKAPMRDRNIIEQYWMRISTLANSHRSLLYVTAGFVDMGSKMADTVVANGVSSPVYLDAVIAIHNAALAHLRARSAAYHKDLLLLNQLAKFYPVCNLIIERIELLRRTISTIANKNPINTNIYQAPLVASPVSSTSTTSSPSEYSSSSDESELSEESLNITPVSFSAAGPTPIVTQPQSPNINISLNSSSNNLEVDIEYFLMQAGLSNSEFQPM